MLLPMSKLYFYPRTHASSLCCNFDWVSLSKLQRDKLAGVLGLPLEGVLMTTHAKGYLQGEATRVRVKVEIFLMHFGLFFICMAYGLAEILKTATPL